MLLVAIIILAWVGVSIPFGLLMGLVLFNGRNDAPVRRSTRTVGGVSAVGAVGVPGLS